MKILSLWTLLLLAIASNSHAADIIDATDPDAIREIARGFGSAKLTRDSEGDPYIEGRIEGQEYSISFYGCDDRGRDCDDILFAAYWANNGLDFEAINAINRDTRFGKAFIDSDGDVQLDMVVNLDYGVTEDNLEDAFKWWTTIVEDFKRDVLNK